jgi:hypothetical protein
LRQEGIVPDRYIDQDETKIYGAYSSRKIRTRVVGLIPAYDKALEYVAGELDAATQAVSEAVEAAREADATIRGGTQARRSALKNAVSLLGRFSSHLDSHAAGKIDRKTYFVTNGTAGGVGKSVPRVIAALQHIAKKLKAKASPVSNSAEWAKELASAATALGPVAEHSDDAKTDRSQITPDVEAARQAWLTAYGAAKLVVESAFRMLGKVDQMSKVFFDLSLPANAKVTEAPADEPEEPGEPADAPVPPEG